MKKIKIKIKGRPGWHIECSVMSQKFLKTDTLDIHAGGRDLIFPHHENEIAQAEALTGKPFAKYWIHHGLLTINGQKMAKSLGNFVTIKGFVERYRYPDILKLFFLSAHYSHPIDYNEEEIESAKQALARIWNFGDEAEDRLHNYKTSVKTKEIKEVEDIKNKFIEAMDDDFNMPQGLASIFELVSLANKNISSLDLIGYARSTIQELLDIFAISARKPLEINVSEKIRVEGVAGAELQAAEIEAKIKERDKARKEKNYSLADKIRKELEEKRIILKDKKDKTTWRRKL